MKIRRKPKTGGHWSETDAKDPIDLVDDWKPGTTFVLDGTIDKDGTRHSLIGLDISEEDVVALMVKVFEHQKTKIDQLQDALESLQIENDQRKAAFQKMETLIEPYIHPDLFHQSGKNLHQVFIHLYELVQFGISEELTILTIPTSTEEE